VPARGLATIERWGLDRGSFHISVRVSAEANRLRQGYGGTPKLYAKAEASTLQDIIKRTSLRLVVRETSCHRTNVSTLIAAPSASVKLPLYVVSGFSRTGCT
jgi:hypothetical protein